MGKSFCNFLLDPLNKHEVVYLGMARFQFCQKGDSLGGHLTSKSSLGCTSRSHSAPPPSQSVGLTCPQCWGPCLIFWAESLGALCQPVFAHCLDRKPNATGLDLYLCSFDVLL